MRDSRHSWPPLIFDITELPIGGYIGDNFLEGGLINLEIIFHTRKAAIAADFKKIATDKINSLQRLHVKVDRIEVEIIHEGNPSQGKRSHTVIITSHGSGPLLRAEAAAFNDLAAFDEAIRKVELQIRKRHERSADHNHQSLKAIPADPDLL